jgi:uncharacterized protein (DUF58 family)
MIWRTSLAAFRLVGVLQRLAERRLTLAGMLVGSATVLAAALGVDTTLTVAYRLFSFGAALMFVAWMAVLLQRGRVEVERRLPRVATAGEALTYRVRVRNTGRGRLDGVALIDEAIEPNPTLAEFRANRKVPTYRGWRRLLESMRPVRLEEAPLPALPPGASAEVVMRGRALRRGVQHFSAVTLARPDPLGLVRGLATTPAEGNLLVLPKRYPLPPIALPGARQYQPGGVALASAIGDSEEFVGLRDYRPGDPLQRIHWKSYARAGEPVVRETQAEYYERHALVLDTFAGAGREAALEEAVSIAASLACTVHTQECLLDLVFVGTQPHVYTAGRGLMSAGGLMEVLAGVGMSAQPFRTLHDAVLARRGQLTGCVLVLLAWDEERRAFVRELQRLGTPVLVLVVNEVPADERHAWLRAIDPARVAEGLAAL